MGGGEGRSRTRSAGAVLGLMVQTEALCRRSPPTPEHQPKRVLLSDRGNLTAALRSEVNQPPQALLVLLVLTLC